MECRGSVENERHEGRGREMRSKQEIEVRIRNLEYQRKTIQPTDLITPVATELEIYTLRWVLNSKLKPSEEKVG